MGVTRVFGCSDDLIEVEGGVASGEVGYYCSDEDDAGCLLVFDDGTLLCIKYGKNDMAIWEIKLVRSGDAFDRIEQCADEDADPYSDQAFFKREMKWCYAATNWQMVK